MASAGPVVSKETRLGKSSREKGKRGEREAALFLTDQGFPARRGVQYHGGPDSPDLICPSLRRLHFEVKRTEKLSIYDALAQADQDAPMDAISVVLHRRNDCGWVVILYADDFLSIVRESEIPESTKVQSG